MRAREIVKELIPQKGYNNADFARRLGIEPTTLWDRLNNKKIRDIPTSLLREMLEPLGYKLLIVPSETPLPTDSFEISDTENKEVIEP